MIETQAGIVSIVFTKKISPAHLNSDKGKNSLAVELRGFEPLTSSMPWKRATNCAIAPRAAPAYRMLSPVGKAALAACFKAVAMVSMAASSWAAERNHASKADGGSATPPSSIAWKNRP